MIFRIFLCYSLQLEAIRGLPGTADPRSYAIRWRSWKYPPLLLNLPPPPLLVSLLSSSSLWGFLEFSLSETADWLTNRGILSLFSLSLYSPCRSRLFSVLPLFSHHLSFGRALSSRGIFEGIRGLQAAPSSSLPASLPPSLSSSSFPPVFPLYLWQYRPSFVWWNLSVAVTHTHTCTHSPSAHLLPLTRNHCLKLETPHLTSAPHPPPSLSPPIQSPQLGSECSRNDWPYTHTRTHWNSHKQSLPASSSFSSNRCELELLPWPPVGKNGQKINSANMSGTTRQNTAELLLRGSGVYNFKGACNIHFWSCWLVSIRTASWSFCLWSVIARGAC